MINTKANKLFKIDMWWMVFPILIVFFAPMVYLKGDVLFEIHDQLDETLFLYKLNAAHMFDGMSTLPEMMSGLSRKSVTVSAPLMVPLYRLFSERTAFLIQYVIVAAAAFMGMYLCVRLFTGNGILGVLCGGFFVFLPHYPVYGLSVVGFPLLLYSFIGLFNEKRSERIPSYVIIAFYVLTSHLSLGGFVSIGLGIVGLIVLLICKKTVRHYSIGLAELIILYILTNLNLILGQHGFVSHRTDFVRSGMPFWETTQNLFLYSGDHAPGMHIWMIIPVFCTIVVGIVLLLISGYQMSAYSKKMILILMGLFGIIVLSAAWGGLVSTDFVVAIQNRAPEFIREFQFDRVYFLIPSLWYMALGVSIAFLFSVCPRKNVAYLLLLGVVGAVLASGVKYILDYNANIWMRNIRQVNAIEKDHKKLDIITWDQLYAYDLFDEIKKEVDSDISSYRVASLGICPVASLMNGFYTIDGYSNFYSKEYKDTFRTIIEKELDKSEVLAGYYDTWGSRCYVFSAENESYFTSKNSMKQYKELEINCGAMKDLGCKYLFSGGEITGAEEKGFRLLNVYETDDSYYRIWVYELI